MQGKNPSEQNVVQRCGNTNECGRDLILITQSTVELPSALQREKKRKRLLGCVLGVFLISSHLNNLPILSSDATN